MYDNNNTNGALGRVTLGTRYRNGTGGIRCNVVNVIRHPQAEHQELTVNWAYTDRGEYNVALLRLDCKVAFSASAGAIALAQAGDTLRDKAGVAVWVSGFGQTIFGEYGKGEHSYESVTLQPTSPIRTLCSTWS